MIGLKTKMAPKEKKMEGETRLAVDDRILVMYICSSERFERC